jgi:hypothetical protein
MEELNQRLRSFLDSVTLEAFCMPREARKATGQAGP